ncbi:hypothetical protein IPL68_01890 [Candidatus Saccharibacteria bacterium]|nr:MAG: hypothetical protein IPL68_01890 [Candidatus Saccharibacteria bacterium]
MDELKKLVGAEVNYVRFSYQVDLNFLGGERREGKYANLQIEVPFQLQTKTKKATIDPNDVSTLKPTLELLHTNLTSIELTNEYVLTLAFKNGYVLQVKPVQKYEAWSLTGDDLPAFVATGL